MSVPAQLEYLYTDQAEINDLLSENGVNLRLDDDDDAAVDADELVRITPRIVNKATARCNLYLLERYDANQLADSWMVHHWATVIGAYMVCQRRGNVIPESLQQEYDQCIEEMQAVKDGDMSLGDVPQRESDQPTFSNVTIDDRYRVRRVRVQRPISEQSPSAIPQNIHHPSSFTVEP